MYFRLLNFFGFVSISAPLGSIPELAAVSCKEIKASEREAVSGRYWLSGVKPNMVVFAFCDMQTEGKNRPLNLSLDKTMFSVKGHVRF